MKRRHMKDALIKSVLAHVAAAVFLLVDLPFMLFHKNLEFHSTPIIVDLNDVQIAEMTNLPPKAKFGEEDKPAEAAAPPKPADGAPPPPKVEEPAPAPEPEQPKPAEPKPDSTPAPEETPTPPKQDFLEAPKHVEKPQDKPAPKVPPKKPAPPKPAEAPKPDAPKKPAEAPKDPKLASGLKNLLASVDQIEKSIGKGNSEATVKAGTDVANLGVEGGAGGSYFSMLTISEVDAIAGRLRACWNLDPGAMGAKDMIVEIVAALNRDGTVRDVKIVDVSRYSSDPHFRSMADSARRAVHICAPYSVFPEHYPDKYDMWSTLRLRFNPLDGGILGTGKKL